MRMAALLTETNVLLAIFAVSFFLLILLCARRPYLLGNSLLLLFTLLALILLVSSLFGGSYWEIAAHAAMAVLLVLALVPLMLIWNGIVMIRRESARLSNVLSLLTGLLIAGGEAAAAVFVLRGYAGRTDILHVLVLPLFAATVFYGAALLLAFVLYMLLLPILPRKKVFDTVIVHGCALLHGDGISRILANRLDLALKLYRKSAERALLVVSGGKGSDETVSEAAAMRGYLLEKGVPKEHILAEDQSHSTSENLRFTDQLLLERGGGGRIALVTSNYHTYRCVWIAHELSFRCTGFGAKVAAYYWPSAVIREFAAVYFQKKYFLRALIGYILFVVGPFAVLFIRYLR